MGFSTKVLLLIGPALGMKLTDASVKAEMHHRLKVLTTKLMQTPVSDNTNI